MALTQVSRGLLSTSIVDNGNATAITIDSSENVGIGLTPNTWAVGKAVELGFEGNAIWGNAADEMIVVQNGYYDGAWKYATTNEASHYSQYNGAHRWFTALSGTADSAISWTQAVTLNASGVLLVGKTAANNGVAGVEASSSSGLNATVSGDTVSRLNRLSSDGEILRFQKDTATVGSINNFSSTEFGLVSEKNLVLTQNTTTERNLVFSSSYFGSFGVDDATIDLGRSAGRFKDPYRSGSTYSTSDRNMKQDIRDLTDAERNVAVAAKGLLKAFRFIDTVAAEGDSANIHFGIIAQDLAAAFEAEGLDANDYQVYKSATTTDDEGNEQTRLNVCYENLLAFIISAI